MLHEWFVKTVFSLDFHAGFCYNGENWHGGLL
jgi:hypothetical protein